MMTQKIWFHDTSWAIYTLYNTCTIYCRDPIPNMIIKFSPKYVLLLSFTFEVFIK